MSLDLFLLIGNLFSVFLFLALYVSLRPVNPSYALVALVVGLIGLVLLIPARPIVELFALSRQYAAATTDAARSQVLAASDALLALFGGTNWFMNTLLGALSLLTSSLPYQAQDEKVAMRAFCCVAHSLAALPVQRAI